jgi:hypothetical protein
MWILNHGNHEVFVGVSLGVGLGIIPDMQSRKILPPKVHILFSVQAILSEFANTLVGIAFSWSGSGVCVTGWGVCCVCILHTQK